MQFKSSWWTEGNIWCLSGKYKPDTIKNQTNMQLDLPRFSINLQTRGIEINLTALRLGKYTVSRWSYQQAVSVQERLQH